MVLLSVCLVVFIGLYYGVPLLHRGISCWLLTQRAKGIPALALTFDDGPGTELTPKVLDVLAMHNSNATFFVLGRNISKRQGIMKRIVAGGHDIGSHGYDHLNHWKSLPWRSVRDVRRGIEALESVLGESARRCAFRPPGGKLNIITLVYLVMKRVPIVYWTLDSQDTWLHQDAHLREEGFMASPSNVVLLHDFDRRDREMHEYVVKTTERLLLTAHSSNVPVVTITQLLA